MNIFVGFFSGLIISLQLLRGDMEQVRRENPMIFNRGVSVTRKLGFPDVIMPGKHNNSNHKILVIFFFHVLLKQTSKMLYWKKIKNIGVILFVTTCQLQIQSGMLKQFNQWTPDIHMYQK